MENKWDEGLPFSRQDRELACKQIAVKPKHSKTDFRLETKWDEGLPFSRHEREMAWEQMVAESKNRKKI